MSFLGQFAILLPYLVATLVSSMVAVALLRGHREVAGRYYFGLLMVTIAVWSFLNFLEDATSVWNAKLIYANLQYPCIGAVPVLFFRFACRYTLPDGPGWLESGWWRAALWVPPVLLAVLVWFDPALGWVRQNLHLESRGTFTEIAKTYGPGFRIWSVYGYGLLLAAAGLWIQFVWKRRRASSIWALVCSLAVFVPITANFLLVSGANPWPGHDPSTPAFSLMGILLMVALSFDRFLSVLPTARQTLMEAWTAPLLAFGPQDHLVYFNQHASRFWNLTRRDWGLPRADLARLAWLPPAPAPGERGVTTAADAASGVVWHVEEWPLAARRFQGTLVAFHDVSQFEASLTDRTAALEQAYVRISDELAHRRRTEQQLFYYSLHDSLTGLANRSLFLSRLGQALERAKRKPEATFGVILLNFAGFKQINDRWGHQVGDEFLVQTSLRLTKTLRTVDTASRSTADTFLLLLDEVASPEHLQEAADRLRAEVESPLSLHGHEALPSVRMGLLWGNSDYVSPEAVLDDAEIALARASKEAGGLKVFDPAWRQTQRDRQKLKEDLGQALVRGDLHLVYQPVVDLATGNLAGFEALSRWNHPTRGLVPPGLFIPLAEQEGTIRPLGLWTLREAARSFSDLGREVPALRDAFVAVNVSPLQFAEPDFASILLGVLEREGLDPRRLHLEITETALVENSDSLLPVLRTLREQGIGIKLDDFGTGYSSLHSLHRLPVDTLKIDRSFVMELPQGAPIIKTILRLAVDLGLDVVAEGIETAEQEAWLRDLGCGSGQGYLYSRGWTREALTQLCASQPDRPEFPWMQNHD